MQEFVKYNPKYKIGNYITVLRKSTSDEEKEFCAGTSGNKAEIGEVLKIEKNCFKDVYPNSDLMNLIYCNNWWYSVAAFEYPEVLRKKYKKFLPKQPKWKNVWKGNE